MTSSASTSGIPVMTAVAPPTTPGAGPTATAAQAPAGDFLLMLGQLIGANAAPTVQPTIIDVSALEDASLDNEASLLEEAADALASGIAPVTAAPVAVAPTPAPLTTRPVVASDAPGIDDIVAELKLAREPASRERLSIFTNAQTLDAVSAQPASLIDAPPTQIEALHVAAAPIEPASARPAAYDAAIARTVHAPVGSQQWADEIGARLTMMAEAGKQTASLRLSPEHLGPLEIRIAINDDHASVWFGAAHADTRAAIEHALPRLRELFEASGMSLADAGVHQEAPRGDGAREAAASSTPSEMTTQEVAASVAVAVKTGLVDAYA